MKITAIILSIAVIMGCFAYSLSYFKTTDPIPEFNIIDAAKQREFGAFTVKVNTGIYIKNFSNFDIIRGHFVVDALVWFEFNSDEVMLETIGKFTFDNGRFLKKSPPDIKIVANKTIATYDVRIDFKSSMNYHQFPLEDHRVSLVMTNNFVTPHEMFFLVDNTCFNIAPKVSISNWRIRDVYTDAGYTAPTLDTKDENKTTTFPKAIFLINMEKAGIKKLLVIFMPLYLAVFLSFFSFLMSIGNVIGRFSLAASGVSALLGYRFVIEKMIPEVGYFTTTDSIFTMLLMINFLVFVWQLLLGRSFPAKPPPGFKSPQKKLDLFEMLNTLVFLFLLVLMTTSSGIFLLQ